MKLINLTISCIHCNSENIKPTEYIPNYKGNILKSFWCDKCKEGNAVSFRFLDIDKVEILEVITTETIYIVRKPDVSITIKPPTREKS